MWDQFFELCTIEVRCGKNERASGGEEQFDRIPAEVPAVDEACLGHDEGLVLDHSSPTVHTTGGTSPFAPSDEKCPAPSLRLPRMEPFSNRPLLASNQATSRFPAPRAQRDLENVGSPLRCPPIPITGSLSTALTRQTQLKATNSQLLPTHEEQIFPQHGTL